MSSADEVPGELGKVELRPPDHAQQYGAWEDGVPRQGGPGGPSGHDGGGGGAGGAASGGAPRGGWLIGGRYQLGDRLGAGGYGTVWRAHDTRVSRDVAVKEPRVPDSLDGQQREVAYTRMYREARAAARIDHPNVVDIYDVVLEHSRPWIVMELVRGQSLAAALDEGSLTPQKAASIALPVLGALNAAHEKGVLHRDVKPGNVILGPFDRVVLADFGIAQVEGESPLTETGVFVGSPGYIAPERVLGKKPGPESDLFSLGVLLYTAVEGFAPFLRQTHAATLQAVIGSTPKEPAQAGGLTPLIVQLLSKDPAARPTVAQAAAVLRHVAEGPKRAAAATESSTLGLRADTGSATVRTRRSTPWLIAGAVAVAAIAAGVGLLPSLLEDSSGGNGSSDGGAHSKPAAAAPEKLPGGWSRREVGGSVGAEASLAVPAGYKLQHAPRKGQVTYADPAGASGYTIFMRREINADGADSLGIAHRQRDRIIGTGAAYHSEDATLQASTLHGRPATELTMTYQLNKEGGDGPYHRKRELYYVDDKGADWWITVNAKASQEGDNLAGDRLFRRVLAHVHLNRR